MSHDTGPIDEWSREALRELGAVLRSLRSTHLISQQALAERCGLSQSTVSRLESGKAPGVRIVWFARLLVSFERDERREGRPWWYLPDDPSWVKQMRRFATNGAFARRLREDSVRRELERQERLMQLQASLQKELLGAEFERDP